MQIILYGAQRQQLQLNRLCPHFCSARVSVIKILQVGVQYTYRSRHNQSYDVPSHSTRHATDCMYSVGVFCSLSVRLILGKCQLAPTASGAALLNATSNYRPEIYDARRKPNTPKNKPFIFSR